MINNLEGDALKDFDLQKSSFEMLENSKIQLIERGKEDMVVRIEKAQAETVSKLKALSLEDTEEILAEAKKREDIARENAKKGEKNEGSEKKPPTSIDDLLNEFKKDNDMDDTPTPIPTRKRSRKANNAAKEDSKVKEEVLVNETKKVSSNTIIEEAYDVIPLPSNGACYPNKKANIKVSYLTASDENVITSPHLYRDGMVIDVLLKRKVLEDDFDTDDLCSGDADAITLWLRATSYGTDFPIAVDDPETGKRIESVVDLTTIKYKPFTLESDENGHFEYILPLSKDVVKFKFLTRKEEKEIDKESTEANDYIYNFNVARLLRDLKNLSNSPVLLNKVKNNEKIIEIIDALDSMMTVDKVEDLEVPLVGTMITTRLEKSIVSINGNEDRDFITKYVTTMRAKDSLMLRRYMLENEPGLDFEIEVERPKSLGGGSFKTFLEWDDTVFLNIT